MIRIIDATLSELDQCELTKEQIFEFMSLMDGIGIKSLQISETIYRTLNGHLPKEFTYYMKVPTTSYLQNDFIKDGNIHFYFVPKQKKGEREIPSYQVNDIEDPNRHEKETPGMLIQIKGLDKLLLNGSTVGLELLKNRFDLKKVILTPENTYHCATGIAILFLQKKGYGVVSTMTGIGNMAATEQILMAMHVLERYMVNRNFCHMSALKDWIEQVTGNKISSMAPVLGEKIFHVESGIHVDGILKKPSNYEPYPPELVGLKREVILGKHSGKSSISYKLELLLKEVMEADQLEVLLSLVKEATRKKGTTLTDEEFIALAERGKKHEKKS